MDSSRHGPMAAHSLKVDMQDGVGTHSSMDEGEGMSQIGNTYELPSLGVGQHFQSSIGVMLISDWNEHLPVYRRSV